MVPDVPGIAPAQDRGGVVMSNITYFVVSVVLVWVLMVGYLGYLHLKLLRLYEIMKTYESEEE